MKVEDKIFKAVAAEAFENGVNGCPLLRHEQDPLPSCYQ